jgi:hypothetical protein
VAHKQTAESFWARVQGNRRQRNGCWEWQGACNNTGYGTVKWDGKTYTTHRIAAWLSGLVKNPAKPTNAQEKAHVLHKCDNRKCCNPTHFFIGSYSDNQLDAYTKKRKSQPKGGNHVNAKLTNKQAAEIRRAYEVHGLTQKQLANKFDVSQTAISKIIRGETYK